MADPDRRLGGAVKEGGAKMSSLAQLFFDNRWVSHKSGYLF